MSTNQFDWIAPAPPIFGGSQASFGYSIHGININHAGSQIFTNYPTGLFGESRYSIGGMFFDVTPNDIRNISLAQPDLFTLYVNVGFEFRDLDLAINDLTYEWRHVGGQFQTALMVAPLLPTITGTVSFMPYTAYWDIRNEPEFLYINAPQNIEFRVTADNGSIWRATQSAPTVLLIDTAPTITSTPPNVAYVRENFVYQPTVSDSQNDIAYWTLVGAPVAMSFNTLTGRMEWKPMDDSVDHIDFTLTVFDTHGMSSVQSFTLKVMLKNPKLRDHVNFAAASNIHNNTGSYQIDLKKKE